METKTLQMVKPVTLLLSDPGIHEKELKVDKKILHIMETGGNDFHPSLVSFLTKISQDIGVHVEVTNSLRDRQGNEIPVLKVKAINTKNLEIASALIMERLDPHRDKMTFNIDVPYNDHSYIIGKDGTRIKQLSRMTGCHIHLPDCNKTSSKKSNKLSIAGTDFTAIDKARDQIRKSLPLNIGFKAQIKCRKFVIIDTASAEVQAVKRKYHVDVTFTNVISNTKYPEVTINVKGSRSQLEEIESATRELYYYVTEESLANNPQVIFAITIDVSHSHHQYVKGKNNCNLKVINQRSGANITFPPNDSMSNLVIIQSKNLLSTVMGWQELMGYLPLLLSFDVNFDINNHYVKLQKLEKEYGVGIRTREKLSGHVYTVLIKTQERHSTYLQEIRQKILNFKIGNNADTKIDLSLVNYAGYRNFSTVVAANNNTPSPVLMDNGNMSKNSILTNGSLKSLNGDESRTTKSSLKHTKFCENCGEIHGNDGGSNGSTPSPINPLTNGNELFHQSLYQGFYNPFNFYHLNGFVDNNFELGKSLPNNNLSMNDDDDGGGGRSIHQSSYPLHKQSTKWPNAENFLMQTQHFNGHYNY